MTRSSTILLLILLLERSIAHEFTVRSKALSRNSCFLRSALKNDDGRFSSSALHVRGGSDYYRGSTPEKKDIYGDPYGRDDKNSSDRYSGDDSSRVYRDDDRHGDDYDDRDYRDSDDRDYRDSDKVSQVSRSCLTERWIHD